MEFLSNQTKGSKNKSMFVKYMWRSLERTQASSSSSDVESLIAAGSFGTIPIQRLVLSSQHFYTNSGENVWWTYLLKCMLKLIFLNLWLHMDFSYIVLFQIAMSIAMHRQEMK